MSDIFSFLCSSFDVEKLSFLVDIGPEIYRQGLCGQIIFWRNVFSKSVICRSNQDNQREFEERAMKQVIALVGKKTGSDLNMQYQTHQQGGTYMRLEAEWRESLKQRASSKAKNAK